MRIIAIIVATECVNHMEVVMPIKIPDQLPARQVLESENIFVITEYRAIHQDIRPLNLLILNLMPTKIVTENQLLRKLSNSPLQVHLQFLQTASYIPRHADPYHMESFYTTFSEIEDRYYDGMIITGAPLDLIEYEDVNYWPELCKIMEWTRTHVHCTMHICWGATAALYYHFNIPTITYPEKLSGVYLNKVMKWTSPLFRGFDDVFWAPHSRQIGVDAADIAKVPELELMADSEQAGPTIVKTTDSRYFFVLCHLEYDRDTLKLEYVRDLEKGIDPKVPCNYFPEDDPEKDPIVKWRAAGQLMYSNWLNYYVYQTTPYDVKEKKTRLGNDWESPKY